MQVGPRKQGLGNAVVVFGLRAESRTGGRTLPLLPSLGLGLCPGDSSAVSISKDPIVFWSGRFGREVVRLAV